MSANHTLMLTCNFSACSQVSGNQINICVCVSSGHGNQMQSKERLPSSIRYLRDKYWPSHNTELQSINSFRIMALELVSYLNLNYLYTLRRQYIQCTLRRQYTIYTNFFSSFPPQKTTSKLFKNCSLGVLHGIQTKLSN